MRVAVACDGLAIAPHFVQSTSYMCYTVANGIVVDCHNIPTPDQPLEMLPDFFAAIEADVLMTGIIDDAAAAVLRSRGMKVVPNMSGDPLTSVRRYLA